MKIKVMTCLLCGKDMFRDLSIRHVGFSDNYTVACECANYNVNFESNGTITSESIFFKEVMILRTLYDTHIFDHDLTQLLFVEYHIRDLNKIHEMAMNAKMMR